MGHKPDTTGTGGEGAWSFGGLEAEREGGAARYSIIPVPYDLTVSYVSGTRGGPRAIIEASAHMELYDEELGGEPCGAGIKTLPALGPTAQGPEEMVRRVKAAADSVLDGGGVPVLLGGEHSVTLGVVLSLAERHPGLSVLQLDAHADMRDSYMDSPFNHACIARRISEVCPVVQLGIRSLSKEEAAFLHERKTAGRDAGPVIATRYAPEVIRAVAAGKAEKLLKGLGDDVYVTIDIDVFDPSVMPSTGTPEPGGLNWYEVLEILSAVAAKKNVVGFDLVELCPQPGNVAPDFLAAKLVYKMMGYMNRALDGTPAG